MFFFVISKLFFFRTQSHWSYFNSNKGRKMKRFFLQSFEIYAYIPLVNISMFYAVYLIRRQNISCKTLIVHRRNGKPQKMLSFHTCFGFQRIMCEKFRHFRGHSMPFWLISSWPSLTIQLQTANWNLSFFYFCPLSFRLPLTEFKWEKVLQKNYLYL